MAILIRRRRSFRTRWRALPGKCESSRLLSLAASCTSNCPPTSHSILMYCPAGADLVFAYLPYDLQLIIIDLMYYAYLSFQIKLTTHKCKGKHSMEINFKCLMPKLMKGATPNELVKGVTANLMSIIGPSVRASETITQRIATLTVPLGGVTITTRLAPKLSLGHY
ncbi:conserved hypothetical protein, partial [Trichinella spiralis]|uniref:hypothetical protein n=1 Tax=Trichinella spiralis TaxID=6334 RepID=UPI0001EFEDD1